MIRNQNLYAHLDGQNRKRQLKQLTRQRGIKYLEELLGLHQFFHSKSSRPQPIALAKVLKSLSAK